jgi:hypothetical protein
MGRGQKGDRSDFITHAYPKEAEAQRGWAKGNHRGYQTALGGFPEITVALRGAPDRSPSHRKPNST